MSYQLGKNIAATVTYYDVMDFPLTVFEIWKHLIEYNRDHGLSGPVSLGEVWNLLHGEQLTKKLEQQDGFYFLPGRSHLVTERIEREKLSVKKLKGMKRLARILAFVPYIRMIGATGSLSMKHGTRLS